MDYPITGITILFSQNSGEGLHNIEVAEEHTVQILQVKRKPRALLLLPGCLGLLRTDRTRIQNSFVSCKNWCQIKTSKS